MNVHVNINVNTLLQCQFSH